MWVSKQVVGKPPESAVRTDRLSLYDRYGAMAYGVITQIIPESDKAQAVLIDLFTSPQLTASAVETRMACAIVRLARQKAFEAKPSELVLSVDAAAQSADTLPTLIFDLSFNKGLSFDIIAERLEITYFEALKAVREYVQLIRTP